MFIFETFTKKHLESMIQETFFTFGRFSTSFLLDSIKFLGFYYATNAGLSITIEDLKTPKAKDEYMDDAHLKDNYINDAWQNGYVSDTERLQRIIQIWTQSTEGLKNRIVEYYERFDPVNTLYVMAFSGARGNMAQVRQLIGMRGLMSDQAGKIIDLPIQRNFCEGLSSIDYIISSYGARKGIVDTGLKTADSGYLTRRLIYLAQDLVIREIDCKSSSGICFEFSKETSYSKVIGRSALWLKQSSFPFLDFSFLLKENSTKKFQQKINQAEIKNSNFIQKDQKFTPILLEASTIRRLRKHAPFFLTLRSPLTCESMASICQICYGWNLSNNQFISLGETVGILAAQSIGEPGTQLTMRTFHTGGIFTSEIRQPLFVPFSGTLSILEPSFVSLDRLFLPIRTFDGQHALKLNQNVVFQIENWKNKCVQVSLDEDMVIYIPPIGSVYKGQLMAESLQSEGIENKQMESILSKYQGELQIDLLPSFFLKLFLKQNQRVTYSQSHQIPNEENLEWAEIFYQNPDYCVENLSLNIFNPFTSQFSFNRQTKSLFLEKALGVRFLIAPVAGIIYFHQKWLYLVSGLGRKQFRIRFNWQGFYESFNFDRCFVEIQPLTKSYQYVDLGVKILKLNFLPRKAGKIFQNQYISENKFSMITESDSWSFYSEELHASFLSKGQKIIKEDSLHSTLLFLNFGQFFGRNETQWIIQRSASTYFSTSMKNMCLVPSFFHGSYLQDQKFFVPKGVQIGYLVSKTQQTVDIVQGLPKIEQLIEAQPPLISAGVTRQPSILIPGTVYNRCNEKINQINEKKDPTNLDKTLYQNEIYNEEDETQRSIAENSFIEEIEKEKDTLDEDIFNEKYNEDQDDPFDQEYIKDEEESFDEEDLLLEKESFENKVDLFYEEKISTDEDQNQEKYFQEYQAGDDLEFLIKSLEKMGGPVGSIRFILFEYAQDFRKQLKHAQKMLDKCTPEDKEYRFRCVQEYLFIQEEFLKNSRPLGNILRSKSPFFKESSIDNVALFEKLTRFFDAFVANQPYKEKVGSQNDIQGIDFLYNSLNQEPDLDNYEVCLEDFIFQDEIFDSLKLYQDINELDRFKFWQILCDLYSWKKKISRPKNSTFSPLDLCDNKKWRKMIENSKFRQGIQIEKRGENLKLDIKLNKNGFPFTPYAAIKTGKKISDSFGKFLGIGEPVGKGGINLNELLSGFCHYHCQRDSLFTGMQKGIQKFQTVLVNSIQAIYHSQGVMLSTKHIELIVRQMTSDVRIYYPGNTPFLRGERIDRFLLKEIYDILKENEPINRETKREQIYSRKLSFELVSNYHSLKKVGLNLNLFRCAEQRVNGRYFNLDDFNMPYPWLNFNDKNLYSDLNLEILDLTREENGNDSKINNCLNFLKNQYLIDQTSSFDIITNEEASKKVSEEEVWKYLNTYYRYEMKRHEKSLSRYLRAFVRCCRKAWSPNNDSTDIKMENKAFLDNKVLLDLEKQLEGTTEMDEYFKELRRGFVRNKLLVGELPINLAKFSIADSFFWAEWKKNEEPYPDKLDELQKKAFVLIREQFHLRVQERLRVQLAYKKIKRQIQFLRFQKEKKIKTLIQTNEQTIQPYSIRFKNIEVDVWDAPVFLPIVSSTTTMAFGKDGFLSAAGFQETRRILTKAAIEGKCDWLNGLKASIMSGKLIPAGSSFFNAKYRLDLFYLHTKLQKE
jgi:hypothetical protein